MLRCSEVVLPRNSAVWVGKMAKAKVVKTVANIESGECRWPFGDPRHADFHFCGDTQLPGRPYCAAHAALSFEAAKAKSAQPRPLLPIRQAA